jgi:hypothetical protein
MTAIWGPMGWMTLHSISLLYPETPSISDKTIVQNFLNDFANSITCPHCEKHFKTMFENYRKLHPEWSSSKFQLFLFIARAHNTVNKRLEKPLKKTVQECLDAFAQGTLYTSASEFRKKYINYVAVRMAAEMNGDNLIKVGQAQSMRRTNESYWNSKIQGELNFDMDANVLEFISDEPTSQRFMMGGRVSTLHTQIGGSLPSFGLKGGRFRLKIG